MNEKPQKKDKTVSSSGLSGAMSASFLRRFEIQESQVGKEPVVHHTSLKPGQMFRHYYIQKELGRGGMGEVYQAVDTTNNHTVALKRLHIDNENARKRFEHEYRFLRTVKHPNLIEAYDYFQQDQRLFMVLEFFAGKPLTQLIKEDSKTLSLLEKLAIASKAARGVEVLNAAGIIHRDIKPDNIMANEELGQVKILDLGLAKNLTQENIALTAPGAVLGTLAYLSPEQTEGEVTERSDIFSLGVTLYQLFSGSEVSPFLGENQYSTFYLICNHHPPLLYDIMPEARGDELHRALSDTIAKAMAKKFEKRWTSAGKIADHLDAILEKSLCCADGQSVVMNRTLVTLSRKMDTELQSIVQSIRMEYQDRDPHQRKSSQSDSYRVKKKKISATQRTKQKELQKFLSVRLIWGGIVGFLLVVCVVIWRSNVVSNVKENSSPEEKIAQSRKSDKGQEQPGSALIKKIVEVKDSTDTDEVELDHAGKASKFAKDLNEGIGALSQGKGEKAIEIFSSIIKVAPHYAQVYYWRGYTYMTKGKYDEALKDYDAAIKIKQNYAQAQYERGMIYLQRGKNQIQGKGRDDLVKAIADFTQAIIKKPNYREAFLHRGKAYEQLGEPELAKEDFRKAKQLEDS